ncbi:MAG: DegQ family serine endoprotease [FCB group bacterium]|jgi:serine protease Do|nr:DegQ family serine endoprotease [FCB group bacterium]
MTPVSRIRVSALVAVAMIAGAAMAAGTLSLTPAKGADLALPAPAVTPVQSGSLASAQALSDGFATIVEQASPAVVFIDVEKDAKGSPAGFFGPGEANPMEFFFGPGMRGRGGRMPMNEAPMKGQGSGFIITPDGYIATNNHVVGDMDRVRVTMADGRRLDAKIIGSDPQTEIALIKVDAEGLPTVPMGDSQNLRVGEWVLAIGSPFGLSHTVTEGIVSARGRGNVGIVDYADFIQTDAAINPGNSGGPLLNLRGEVIGMNTAILSPSGSSAGIGFAIPVNMVKYVAGELQKTGKVTRGYLGVSIQDLTPDLAKYFGIDKNQGVLVADVSPGSPAEKAGLKRDDVIVSLNGQPIGEGGAFRTHVATTAPGSTARVTVLREGQTIEKDVTVGTLPSRDGEADVTPASNDEEPEARGGRLGVALAPLTAEIAQQLNYENEKGVVVTGVQPGSPAARAGIRPGALIKEINREPVSEPEQVKGALKEGARDNTVLLLIREGAGTRYVAVDLA